MAAMASTAAAASGARPRLVWRTTPVALSTGRRPGAGALDEALADLRRPVVGWSGAPGARGGERLADRRHDRGAGRGTEQSVHRGLAQEPVHGGKLPPPVGHEPFFDGGRLSESAPVCP